MKTPIVNFYDGLIKHLTYSIVTLIPCSFLILLNTSSFKLSISDLLIVFGLAFLVLKFLGNGFKSIILPAKELNLFMICCLLSGINAGSFADFLKDFLQLSLSFYLLYIFLIHAGLSKTTNNKLIIILIISSAFLILHAIYQYYLQEQHPYFVRSLFPNRNLLGIYLAGTLPFVFGKFFYSKNLMSKVLCFIILELSFFVILSFGHLISLILTLTVMLWLINKKWLVHFGILLLLNISLYPFITPGYSSKEFEKFSSIYEKGDITKNIRRGWFYNDLPQKAKFFETKIGEVNIQVSNDLLIPLKLTKREGLSNEEYARDEKKVIKQYYAEWQSSLNLLEDNLFTGCGLGNYQNNIGKYYLDLPKNNTSEPNFINGYSVIWSTTGILGFIFFMILIFHSGKNVLRQFKKEGTNKELAISSFGSLIALGISNLFTPILISQIIILFTFIIYLTNKSSLYEN